MDKLSLVWYNISTNYSGGFTVSKPMRMTLDIKKASDFYWLRKFRAVSSNLCRPECFTSEEESKIYHGTAKQQTPHFIDIKPAERYYAYLLCGCSKGVAQADNMVAFVHQPGEMLHVVTEQVDVKITNARELIL